MGVPLQTSTLPQLQLKFNDLHPSLYPLLDQVDSFDPNHYEQGFQLLQGSISHIQDFAKRGICASLRPLVWKVLLHIDQHDFHAEIKRTIYSLEQRVEKFNLLMDRVVELESKHCQNDDHYFVFEETIRDVLLYWSRDDWVSNRLSKLGYDIPEKEETLDASLNTVYPIWGISLYVMPLCYVFEDPGELYIVFRQLYTKYFYQLHCPSDKQYGILSLTILFENLLKQKHMDLFLYLHRDLGIQPLDIAFKWILYAFVGVLESDQVLLLWDRMIAFDSLEILALTAAALFSFRKDCLMLCQSKEEAIVKLINVGLF
jgi:hypothetical protein